MQPIENGSSGGTCYCNSGRLLTEVELQCALCMGWFHAKCVTSHVGHSMPFMLNYKFCCRKCNPAATEALLKKRASLSQMCLTALAQLSFAQKPRTKFSLEQDIITLIDNHWEKMTIAPRRVNQNLTSTLLNVIIKDTHLFVCEQENSDWHVSLVCSDLTTIGPYQEQEKQASGVKRKQAVSDLLQASKSVIQSKLSIDGHPLEYPWNKDGYRYYLAEIDPHAPGRQAFDESQETFGKAIPGFFYRKFLGAQVLLSLHDRAPQLKLSDDRLSVTGDKGYSMVRATHGVHAGNWYFEFVVDSLPADSAVRIGWSQKLGNLQAPCGYDKFSYSWRSRKGTVFHQSRGRHYSSGFDESDVLGALICLPPAATGLDAAVGADASLKQLPLIRFKNHYYYEQKDEVAAAEKALRTLPGSCIYFVRNGQILGSAHVDLFQGVYYPCVSLFRNACVTLNFGPDFQAPPLQFDGSFSPMSEAAVVEAVDNSISNLLYIVSNEQQNFDDP